MRDTMTLPAILDDCLRRLQAGETIAACLDHYPDQASELAPLLTAAARLRPLAGQGLSDAQRAQGRAVVRAAARTHATRATQPRSQQGWGWMKSRAFGLAMAGIATVLVLALAGTTVLASQPGDVSYPLRVVAERAPAALRFSPAGRANAELGIADRRLDDLESHLRATRQVEAAALAALIRGDEAAARRAIDLPETQRRLVAQRIDRHAAAILRLADRAETPAIETRLQQVASRMKLVAIRLRLGLPPDQRNQTGLVPPATATATEKPAWTATPTATRTPIQATPLGQASVPATATTTPTSSAWPEPPQGTSEPPTAQPDAPAATSTATSQPGRTDTATPTQVIPPTPTPIATTAPTTIVRPSRTPRPPITPQASRTPRPTRTPVPPITPRPTRTPVPPITPRPTRTPVPPITPRPTRTPRPPLTPRPQPTIQPTEIMEPTPTQTGVTATPTASGPQPTPVPTPTPTEGPSPAESPTPVATPTLDPGSGGATPPPTSMPPPRPTRPRRS